jgi:hypothetical protein
MPNAPPLCVLISYPDFRPPSAADCFIDPEYPTGAAYTPYFSYLSKSKFLSIQLSKENSQGKKTEEKITYCHV